MKGESVKSLSTSSDASLGGNLCFAKMKFEDANHIGTMCAALNEMRKTGQLCDITLVAGGVRISSHRVVLAAHSSYFNAMFSSDMAEKSKPEVTLHEVEPNALKLLVEYIYTGQLLITEENVLTLLATANLFQILVVRNACCSFLHDQLHPTNCLGIHKFADTHCCEELQVSSLKYALDNFQEVSLTDEFLALSFDDLTSLISANHLNVSDERSVYTATIRWLKHDLKTREDYLAALLAHVRLPLIERVFLVNQVIDESLVRRNSEAKDLVIEAMKYQLCPENRSEILTPRTQHRQPDGLHPYIFAVGGGSLFTTHNECEYLDPRHGKWVSFAATQERRSRTGVTSLNRYIYAIGGYNGNKNLSSVECYDPLSNVWSYTASMGCKRSCHGVAQLNGLIYAAGGYDGTTCLGTVERFDPLISAWFSVNSLEVKRRYTRLVALNGSLYIIGGFDGSNYLASVERYDPREGKWTPVAPMLSRRSSCGAAVLNGRLYAVGGNDGSLCMCSAERYDPVRNGWENITAMQHRRSTHELVAVEDELYALGGNDGSNSLNVVECYREPTNKWSVTSSMNLRRSGLGAVLLHSGPMKELVSEKLSVSHTSILTKSLDSKCGEEEMDSLTTIVPLET